MDLDAKLAFVTYMLISLVASASILALYAMVRTLSDKSRNRRFAVMLAKLREIHKDYTDVDKMKTTFINSITHEIRTPMNAINGFSTLLSNDYETLTQEERQECLQAVEDSSRALSGLIEDLVNLSGINNAETKVNPESVSFSEIINLAKQNYKPNKGVIMMVDNMVPDTAELYSDKNIIVTILNTLLSNACKFTRQGSIEISCDYSRDMKSILLSVADTGPGIPADKMDVIFNRFTKLDEFAPGNGLGLYVGKKEANLIGGSLYCDPRHTEGARFVLELPLNKLAKNGIGN